ncbi:hypothetical protein DW036_02190 [Bacteroides sp. AF39-11AC]|nr:hypothetical protein DW036_02190 [Bacteroides sp. AF39-11AC]
MLRTNSILSPLRGTREWRRYGASMFRIRFGHKFVLYALAYSMFCYLRKANVPITIGKRRENV